MLNHSFSKEEFITKDGRGGRPDLELKEKGNKKDLEDWQEKRYQEKVLKNKKKRATSILED